MKELLHLRTYALKYYMAHNKSMGKNRRIVCEDNKTLGQVMNEIYTSFAILFIENFKDVNVLLPKTKKLDINSFLNRGGLIDLWARRKVSLKATTISGLKDALGRASVQESKNNQKNISKINNNIVKDNNNVHKHVVKSFKLKPFCLNFDRRSEFTKKEDDPKLSNVDIEDRVVIEEFDLDVLRRISEVLVLSEDSLISKFSNSGVERVLSDEQINAMKTRFVKYSSLSRRINVFDYTYKEDEILRELRICADLRVKYLKYKAICQKDEKLCDKLDMEEFYLDSILDDMTLIVSRLIYYVLKIFSVKILKKDIDKEAFVQSSVFMDFLVSEKISKVQVINDFSSLYESIQKEHLIARYEKNPASEYPEARAMKRKFIIHTGQTNSGKTYEAIEDLKKAVNGTYLAPLRLLAIEVQEKLLDSGVQCGLLTGEEEFSVKNSTHISSTVEKANFINEFEVAVIDECQMIGDRDRGGAWTSAIMGLKARAIHLCTAPSAVDLLIKLIESCGDEYEIVEHKRNTKLVMDDEVFKSFSDCKRGDALIVFSKKNVLSVASALLNKGIKSSIIYGALPYQTRKLQMERFLNGETDVIVSTDAISMGLNLPIKRVVFIDTRKYDGFVKRKLFTEEVKQIAGRAGRYGMYDIGYVNALENYNEIKSKLSSGYWKIEKAKLQLPESIINIDGNLSEIISLWKNVDYLDGFEKCSVDRELEILKMINDLGYSDIGNTYKYKLATMYFAEDDRKTYFLWVKYLNLYFRELEDEMPKPDRAGYADDLQGLESYYKSIELYYVFSKAFNLDMDLEWVRQEKFIVSEKINECLISEVRRYQKKCRVCGKELKWDSPDTICTECALYEAFGGDNSSIRLKRA